MSIGKASVAEMKEQQQHFREKSLATYIHTVKLVQGSTVRDPVAERAANKYLDGERTRLQAQIPPGIHSL